MLYHLAYHDVRVTVVVTMCEYVAQVGEDEQARRQFRWVPNCSANCRTMSKSVDQIPDVFYCVSFFLRY